MRDGAPRDTVSDLSALRVPLQRHTLAGRFSAIAGPLELRQATSGSSVPSEGVSAWPDDAQEGRCVMATRKRSFKAARYRVQVEVACCEHCKHVLCGYEGERDCGLFHYYLDDGSECGFESVESLGTCKWFEWRALGKKGGA